MFMKYGLLSFIVTIGLSNTSASQEALTLNIEEESNYLNWNSAEGRTYFIQWSDDLKTWQFLPIIVSGNGNPTLYEIQLSQNDRFFRLFYTDQETDDPYNDDFDGDGISNFDEIRDGGTSTNPLAFASDPSGVSDFDLDRDGDGLSNGLELLFATSLTNPDSDSDGLIDGNEILLNRNPHLRDHPAVLLRVN